MSGEAKPRRWALWLPLALFAAFVGLVLIGLLRPASRDVASAMVGKPLPQFTLRAAVAERPGLATRDLIGGRPRLLNVFASWCIPCAVEAPQLAALAGQGVEIHGVAIRDRPEDVAAFLARHGNPYARIGADDVSAVQLAIGFVRRAGDFRGRCQGHDPLPAHRRNPRGAGADDPGETAGGRAVRPVLLALLVLVAAPALAQDSLPPAPYAYRQLDDPAQEARAKALMETLRCITCQGQSIADSDAPLAGDMRNQVRQRIAAGEDAEAIRGWLIERYGDYVSYAPRVTARTWPLFALPLFVLALAALLLRRRFGGSRG